MEELDRLRRLDLNDIARQIDEQVAAADASWNKALEHAIRAGDLLNEAKDRLKHGQWLDWLKNNTSVAPRTAQDYMLLARQKEGLKSAGPAHLGIQGALRALAARKQALPDVSEEALLARLEAGEGQPEPLRAMPPEWHVPIDSLKPFQRRARTGPLDYLKLCLRLHGQMQPLVATRDGTILAGNRVWDAASALEWDKIAVVRSPLDPESHEAAGLYLAMNPKWEKPPPPAEERPGRFAEFRFVAEDCVDVQEALLELRVAWRGLSAKELIQEALRRAARDPGEPPPAGESALTRG